MRLYFDYYASHKKYFRISNSQTFSTTGYYSALCLLIVQNEKLYTVFLSYDYDVNTLRLHRNHYTFTR